MSKFYKFVSRTGRAIIARDASPWDLPRDGNPGAWYEVSGDLVACRNAIHLLTFKQLGLVQARWLQNGALCFEVEVDGEVVKAGRKYLARKARLVNDVTVDARRFCYSAVPAINGDIIEMKRRLAAIANEKKVLTDRIEQARKMRDDARSEVAVSLS